MRVVDYFGSTPTISFEIIPPLRGDSINKVISLLDELAKYKPPFIDVTSHSAGINSLKKRPGTLGICVLIQHHYKIDAVPHVLCKGFSREETEDFLLDVSYLGITNLMALQGDRHEKIREGRTSNTYAVDLVRQVQELNQGKYLHSENSAASTNFCIGVAGYPEKHAAATDIATDLKHLKQKVNAGASYIVTQMFFDNSHYLNFVEQCRQKGITVPIIPGLKILTSLKQLTIIPPTFNIEIPSDLAREVNAAPAHALEIGVAWASQQAQQLLDRGAPGIHLYVMNDAKPVHALLQTMGA